MKDKLKISQADVLGYLTDRYPNATGGKPSYYASHSARITFMDGHFGAYFAWRVTEEGHIHDVWFQFETGERDKRGRGDTFQCYWTEWKEEPPGRSRSGKKFDTIEEACDAMDAFLIREFSLGG